MGFYVLTALRAAFAAIVPANCAGCGSYGSTYCDACRTACSAGPLLERSVSSDFVSAGTGIRVFALGTHEGDLRRAIHALKYRNRRAAAHALGQLLGQKLKATVAGPASRVPWETIIPIPLHQSRLRDRGYNQSELIGRAVSAELRMPLVGDALVRVLPTLPQSELDLREREMNVRGAFGAGSGVQAVAQKSVLLVDDVVTTGATLRACARVLRANGAARIMAAALALRR